MRKRAGSPPWDDGVPPTRDTPVGGSARSASGRRFLIALSAARRPALLRSRPPYFCGVELTVDSFRAELAVALKSYDRHVVCLEKLPDDCEAALRSLLQKAINAYLARGADMRHGIALDRHVTVILSQTDGQRPLCGIYFNLHSPYSKKPAAKLDREHA